MSQRREKERRKRDRYPGWERDAWLQRRPPWWKFWAVRKWKGEEPK